VSTIEELCYTPRVKTQHGTILKKSGSWTGRYSRWFVDAATGKKIRQQKSFVIGSCERITKAEARRLLRTRIEQELGIRADSRITLKQFIEQRWVPLREGSWRKSTRTLNEWMLGLINERFGTVALEDADAVDLQVWLNNLAKTRSASLVRHLRILLRSIFSEAAEQDYIRKSPARLLRIPDLKPVAKPYLAQEQVKRLLSVARGMDRIILRLLFCTGLRPSELFALRWKCLDAANRLLHITESVYRGEIRAYTKTTDQDSRQSLQVVFLPQSIVLDLVAWREHQRQTWVAPNDYQMPEDKYGFWTAEEKKTMKQAKELQTFENTFMFGNSMNGNFIWKENYYHRNLVPLVCKAFHDGSCAKEGIKCKNPGVPLLNYQVIRRTVATHAQNLGSPKDIAAILRHTKVDTAQLHYVQQQDESVRQTTEKLAALLD
jgi:integrase